MATSSLLERLATLKSYLNQLSEGERTPAEVGAALNEWAREGAESVKLKIAEEVEASVSKMGFIKREEYDLLLKRVEQLEAEKAYSAPKKSPAKKSAPAKRIVKESVVKAKKRVSK